MDRLTIRIQKVNLYLVTGEHGFDEAGVRCKSVADSAMGFLFGENLNDGLAPTSVPSRRQSRVDRRPCGYGVKSVCQITCWNGCVIILQRWA